jgi:hypothetical protein
MITQISHSFLLKTLYLHRGREQVTSHRIIRTHCNTTTKTGTTNQQRLLTRHRRSQCWGASTASETALPPDCTSCAYCVDGATPVCGCCVWLCLWLCCGCVVVVLCCGCVVSAICNSQHERSLANSPSPTLMATLGAFLSLIFDASNLNVCMTQHGQHSTEKKRRAEKRRAEKRRATYTEPNPPEPASTESL